MTNQAIIALKVLESSSWIAWRKLFFIYWFHWMLHLVLHNLAKVAKKFSASCSLSCSNFLVVFHILSSSDRKSNFKYFLSEESSLLLLSPCNNLRSILLSVTIDVHIVISIDPTWLYYVDKWKLRSEVFFSLLNALVCCASLSVISFIYIQSGAADTHSKRLRNNNNWKKIKNFKVFRWKFEIGV